MADESKERRSSKGRGYSAALAAGLGGTDAPRSCGCRIG